MGVSKHFSSKSPLAQAENKYLISASSRQSKDILWVDVSCYWLLHAKMKACRMCQSCRGAETPIFPSQQLVSCALLAPTVLTRPTWSPHERTPTNLTKQWQAVDSASRDILRVVIETWLLRWLMRLRPWFLRRERLLAWLGCSAMSLSCW